MMVMVVIMMNVVADKKSPAAEESCSPPLSPSASFTRSYTGPGPLNTAANTSNNNINTTNTSNSSSSLDNKETAPSKLECLL